MLVWSAAMTNKITERDVCMADACQLVTVRLLMTLSVCMLSVL